MQQGEKKMIFPYWISAPIVIAVGMGIFTETDTTRDMG